MQKPKCPKCGSKNTERINYSGTEVITCNDCGYDEAEEMEAYPEQKTSQKEKARYSPYKKGGKERTRN